MLKYILLITVALLLNCVQAPFISQDITAVKPADIVTLSPYVSVFTSESKQKRDFTVIRTYSVSPYFISNHPELFKIICDALKEWVDSVPCLEIGLSTNVNPVGIPFVVGELTEGPFFTNPNTLGFYYPIRKHIAIDDDIIGSQPEHVIKKLIMHEIGHTLGLPHIIGRNTKYKENLFPFIQYRVLVVPTEEQAKKMLMYPYLDMQFGTVIPEIDESYSISELEAALVEKYLLAHLLEN